MKCINYNYIISESCSEKCFSEHDKILKKIKFHDYLTLLMPIEKLLTQMAFELAFSETLNSSTGIAMDLPVFRKLQV